MTLESLLDALVKDQAEEVVQVWHGELELEPATGGMRIVRASGAPQPLVAVVGLSQSGLPNAIALRRAGFRIVGIDTSSSRLNNIRGGLAGLSREDREELESGLEDDQFVLTGSVEAIHAADVVLICIPVVLDAQRRPNLDALTRTCETVVHNARAGQTLVLTTSSYVGSTRELLVEPLAQRGLRAGEDVFVAFSPERADPGVPEHEQLRVPRVVGPATESCGVHASELLRNICGSLHCVSSPEVAEMAKLYESTFRAVNIALAFEMADACAGHRLDPIEVTDAAATKPFGFLAHYPSAGVGGHGVRVDPHCLLHQQRERGRPALFAEEAMRTLAARPRRVAMRAQELLLRSGRRLRDARVVVVGAAYKPGVADASESPSLEIISSLLAEGVHVDYHDPLVPSLCVDGEEVHGIDPDPRRDASGFGPEDYDLAILVTLQPGYDYGWLRRCAQVLDCTYSEPTGCRCIVP